MATFEADTEASSSVLEDVVNSFEETSG